MLCYFQYSVNNFIVYAPRFPSLFSFLLTFLKAKEFTTEVNLVGKETEDICLVERNDLNYTKPELVSFGLFCLLCFTRGVLVAITPLQSSFSTMALSD